MTLDTKAGRVIAEFLDWLEREQGVVLAKWSPDHNSQLMTPYLSTDEYLEWFLRERAS